MISLWVNSCLHVAVGAGLLSYASATFFNQDQAEVIGLFAFLGTWSVYLAQRLFKRKRLGLTQVHEHILDNKRSYGVISLLTGIAAAFVASILDTRVLILSGISFFLALIYIYFPGKQKALRNSGITKILLVTMVWTLVTAVIPSYEELVEQPDSALWMFYAERFAFIAMITIPFDVRDLLRDSKSQKTIPSILGKTGTRILIFLLLAICVVLCFFSHQVGYYTAYTFGALVMVYLFAFILSFLSRVTHRELYFTFFIDGTLILLAAALLSEGLF
ncbi:MAG: UbiA family prenyltransferase [Luteibaculum sp.]